MGSTSRDLNVRIRLTATFVPSAVVAAASLSSRLRNRIDTGTSQSNNPNTRSRNFLSMCSGKLAIHERHSGRHPSWCGSRYTIPHRDTVAGLATARSATSKIMFMLSLIFVLVPLFRQSVLLSSNTVFMFSIQMASTGPSSMTHILVALVSAAHPLYTVARTPSCHSCVCGSFWPYSWPMEMLFGFRTRYSHLFWLSSPRSAMMESARARTR